ncbi:MAG: DoxX family protein [Acidimicrobiales bacterium]
MSTSQHTALLIIRVCLGSMMFAHGYNKFFRGGRLKGTAGWFDSIGMRPGNVHALLAASTEVGTGVLFAAGLLTPLAAAGMVGVMFVAAWTHRENGFFIVKDGWEYNFIISVVAVGVATLGAGRYSLDHVFDIEANLAGWRGLAISGGVGLASGAGLLAAFYRPPAKAEPEAEADA